MLHIAPEVEWNHQSSTGGLYLDPSLHTEGFIHCSTADQVLLPANAIFSGRDDLLMLVIDLTKVPSQTVFEDCYEAGMEFPHIYGPIPTDAVTRVVPFPCSADGTFELPAELHDLRTAN